MSRGACLIGRIGRSHATRTASRQCSCHSHSSPAQIRSVSSIASSSRTTLSGSLPQQRQQIRAPFPRPQIRHFASPTLKFKQSNISVEDYQRLSDGVLDNLTDYLEQLTQEHEGENAEEWEVEYSSGVLNLRLAEHGTYVINKQPANKQIWFSSPISGPKRFDYDGEHKAWFMLKEGEEWNMRDLLNRELSKIFDREVQVDLGEEDQ